MTTFWSLAAIMMIVALLFTVPPLLRNREITTTSVDELNIKVVRAQLDELQADLEAGRLDKEQYAAARADLENELLYDLSGSQAAASQPAARSGRWIAVVVAVTVPLLAVWLYDQLGAAKLIDILQQQAAAPPAQQTQAQAPTAPKHDMADLVEQLAQKLESDPDNLEGWALLARSYMSQKRYAEAVNAYGNVRRLGGDSAPVLADYADAMVTANGGQFTDEAGELLTRAIELDHDNVKALWLIGHWKFSQEDYASAAGYWQRAAPLLPPDSQNAAILKQQIQQARSRMDGSDAVAAAPVADTAAGSESATPAATAAKAVTVHVELDPELGDKASPQDTVFIFARATSGPRMPLAVHRGQVQDLPLTVTLDDSTAMTPAMKLSRFDAVTIGALVSRAGVAMPESGDLQGTVSPVPTSGADTVQLMIDTLVP